MAPHARVFFHDLQPDAGSFLEDVIAGLSQPQKALNPKYFYDERGCELFEAICELPEYYPTRTEMAMMRAHVHEMTRRLGPGCALIEYGSGSSLKTRALIAELGPAVYMPIDIAAAQLRKSSIRLAEIFPDLLIAAVCADYSRPLALPDIACLKTHRRVIYFPGSTIGNFTVPEARQFLHDARRLAGAGGAMLVGVDLKKDHGVLHAAYNDTQGVTAAFNLNLLARINRELGADFDLAAFSHRAFYDSAAGRIEMHLVSLAGQWVKLGGYVFPFRAGETIHTENSYKYSVAEFQDLARSAGFEPEECWTDPQRLFAVHYLAVPR
ncbi:MAG: dimethylhistidine N-methyltransferase [Betaproteobacteria bacterium RIFCSPLOWO2_12_FULL_62_13]|nr:MAG: dimethylhistidine N-methyltransferase [Betaproteobacteria bacterium RIFCSPLOWO2_12_FULL_62_13]